MALTNDEATWVQGVSAKTGIDPRVLVAWVQSEGHPGDTAHNYLNIKTTTAESIGVPTTGTLAAGTAAFGSVQDGITAAVKEIQSLGLTHEVGKTPAETIHDIASTGWATSHYSRTPKIQSTWGENLDAVFAGIFGGNAGLNSSYQGPGTAGGVATTAGTGSASIPGSPLDPGSSGTGPVGAVTGAVGSAVGAVGSALSFPERAFKFVTSWRFAEVVGGFLLLLVGLYLLGRQFGLNPPTPPAARAVEAAGPAAAA